MTCVGLVYKGIDNGDLRNVGIVKWFWVVDCLILYSDWVQILESLRISDFF